MEEGGYTFPLIEETPVREDTDILNVDIFRDEVAVETHSELKEDM